MTETKCFRDAFRDQLHKLSGQPNIFVTIQWWTKVPQLGQNYLYKGLLS